MQHGFHLKSQLHATLVKQRMCNVICCAAELGWSLWQRLVTKVQADPVLSAPNYQINSAVHRAKVRAWQALAVLSAFIPAEPAIATQVAIDQLWPYLQVGLLLPVILTTNIVTCRYLTRSSAFRHKSTL